MVKTYEINYEINGFFFQKIIPSKFLLQINERGRPNQSVRG